MEISCLTTRLGRPLILQKQMSSYSRYLVGITSTFFPPFVLVGPLLRYFLDQRQRFAFTIIVPRLHPCRYWWAILQALAIDSLLLGRKGDSSVLQFPSSSSPVFAARPLPWDLWAFRCICPG